MNVNQFAPKVLDALDRCHTSFRLYASSTGAAFGGFYQICTEQAHLRKVFRVKSSDCPHISAALIEADRENLKDSVFKIKHDCQWLFDSGDSTISLESARALIDNPPPFVPGPTTGFCDFASSGDESVLALCEGNRASVVDAWRSRDTTHSVGKFLKTISDAWVCNLTSLVVIKVLGINSWTEWTSKASACNASIMAAQPNETISISTPVRKRGQLSAALLNAGPSLFHTARSWSAS